MDRVQPQPDDRHQNVVTGNQLKRMARPDRAFSIRTAQTGFFRLDIAGQDRLKQLVKRLHTDACTFLKNARVLPEGFIFRRS